MIYLDTSYLVRLYFRLRGSRQSGPLAATDHLACALHGQAEMVAAFHRKLREGAITLKSFRAMLAQFETDHKAGAFHWLPSSPEVLQRVRDVYAGLANSVYLRGADSLHLATAALNGFGVVYSNDAHLLAAAGNFGLKGVNVIPGR